MKIPHIFYVFKTFREAFPPLTPPPPPHGAVPDIKVTKITLTSCWENMLSMYEFSRWRGRFIHITLHHKPMHTLKVAKIPDKNSTYILTLMACNLEKEITLIQLL